MTLSSEAVLENKKPSALLSRGQEFSWYHLSLSPLGDLMGFKQIRRLYRALPVFAYCTSAKPLRKEFHFLTLTALHPPAALWQDL